MVIQWFQTIVLPPILSGKWFNCRRFFDLVVETPIKPINNFLRFPFFFCVCVCVCVTFPLQVVVLQKVVVMDGSNQSSGPKVWWQVGTVVCRGCPRAVWAINWLCRVTIGDEILPSYVGIIFHNPWSGSLWNKKVRGFFRFLFVSRMPVPRKEEV